MSEGVAVLRRNVEWSDNVCHARPFARSSRRPSYVMAYVKGASPKWRQPKDAKQRARARPVRHNEHRSARSVSCRWSNKQRNVYSTGEKQQRARSVVWW